MSRVRIFVNVHQHKFGVLNVLDLKQTLGNKGVVLECECGV